MRPTYAELILATAETADADRAPQMPFVGLLAGVTGALAIWMGVAVLLLALAT